MRTLIITFIPYLPHIWESKLCISSSSAFVNIRNFFKIDLFHHANGVPKQIWLMYNVQCGDYIHLFLSHLA